MRMTGVRAAAPVITRPIIGLRRATVQRAAAVHLVTAFVVAGASRRAEAQTRAPSRGLASHRSGLSAQGTKTTRRDDESG